MNKLNVVITASILMIGCSSDNDLLGDVRAPANNAVSQLELLCDMSKCDAVSDSRLNGMQVRNLDKGYANQFGFMLSESSLSNLSISTVPDSELGDVDWRILRVSSGFRFSKYDNPIMVWPGDLPAPTGYSLRDISLFERKVDTYDNSLVWEPVDMVSPLSIKGQSLPKRNWTYFNSNVLGDGSVYFWGYYARKGDTSFAAHRL